MDTMAGFASKPCCGISGVVLDDRCSLKTSRVSFVGVGKRNMVLRNVFSDSSHLEYYGEGGGKEMKVKKTMIKKLSKDLDFISRYEGEIKGLGLVGDDKGNLISDAAEMLLAEVRQLKAAQKEEKRRKKAEKEQRKGMCGEDSSSESSSSSSESSNDECQPVVNLRSLRSDPVVEKPAEAEPVLAIANDVVLPTISDQTQETVRDDCCNEIGCESGALNRCNDYAINGVAVESAVGKIEVCMGGKCKKMGSQALMEEFERKVGVEGAVVGCKCMGKCKNAPNVRVSRPEGVAESIGCGDSSVTAPTNPLFLGVGLNDVDMIIAHFEANDSYEMMPNCK